MRSIWLFVVVIGILVVLPAAVVLRSGGAVADADPPTKEQITEQCVQEISAFAMSVMALQASGDRLEDVLAKNPKLAPILVDILKAIYSGDNEKIQAAANASMTDCIRFYSAKTTRRA